MEDSTAIDQDTYREASNHTPEADNLPRDDHDRPAIHALTDRAIAEETLMWLRGFADTLQAAGDNPMLRAMIPSLRK